MSERVRHDPFGFGWPNVVSVVRIALIPVIAWLIVRDTAQAAWTAFEELEEKWGKPYPAIPRLWRAAWEQFIPFLDYDVEIRRVLSSTNAIESLNARYRRAVTVKGHFPSEQAALKSREGELEEAWLEALETLEALQAQLEAGS